MPQDIKFEDYSVHVKNKIADVVKAWLIETSHEICSQAQRNSKPVDTGQLKASWVEQISTAGGEYTAKVGSPLENAIWEEFGTGHYALEGNGRKTPWYVPVDGYTGRRKPTYFGKVVVVTFKDGKKFYKTNGKKPKRALYKAFKTVEPKAQRNLEKKLKELG